MFWLDFKGYNKPTAFRWKKLTSLCQSILHLSVHSEFLLYANTCRVTRIRAGTTGFRWIQRPTPPFFPASDGWFSHRSCNGHCLPPLYHRVPSTLKGILPLLSFFFILSLFYFVFSLVYVILPRRQETQKSRRLFCQSAPLCPSSVSFLQWELFFLSK